MNSTKFGRWSAVAALSIAAAAGTAGTASASEETTELRLWGWASSEAEAEVGRRRAEGRDLVDVMRREAEAEREVMLADGERARAEAEATAEQIRAAAREQGRRLVGDHGLERGVDGEPPTAARTRHGERRHGAKVPETRSPTVRDRSNARRGAPGSGELDLDAFVGALEAAGYDGPVGLEFFADGPTRDQLGFLAA